jgi:hypothetical protein
MSTIAITKIFAVSAAVAIFVVVVVGSFYWNFYCCSHTLHMRIIISFPFDKKPCVNQNFREREMTEVKIGGSFLHEHLRFSNYYHHLFEARFTLGVRANVQPKSSIPIGAKVEIKAQGFTLGVKADIEKNFSICPKLVINAEH